jgi:outer membrane protein assembly factor BamD (BamD/ComL family)
VALLGLVLVISACGKGKLNDKGLLEQGLKLEQAQQFSQAYDTYMTLVKDYPKSPHRYKALFMAGMVQFDYLNDTEQATKLFAQLIDEYPDCDLADDAEALTKIINSGDDLMSVFDSTLKSQPAVGK